MNTQLEILLIKKVNEKYYLQNTKTSSNNGQKKKKKIVQQSEHEFYIGNGIFYNRDDWNPESA